MSRQDKYQLDVVQRLFVLAWYKLVSKIFSFSLLRTLLLYETNSRFYVVYLRTFKIDMFSSNWLIWFVERHKFFVFNAWFMTILHCAIFAIKKKTIREYLSTLQITVLFANKNVWSKWGSKKLVLAPRRLFFPGKFRYIWSVCYTRKCTLKIRDFKQPKRTVPFRNSCNDKIAC